MVQFYTYLHCKPDGTPFYVGKGNGNRALEFYKRNTHHKNIVEKYSRANIDVFIFPRESEQDAFDTEIRWIAQFKREGVKLANQTNGGEGTSGYKLSPEIRSRITSSNFGRVHSNDTRKKMSEAAKGKKKTEIHKLNIAIKLAGNKNNSGKTLSELHKEKISYALKGKIRTPEHCANISSARKGKPLSVLHKARIKESLAAIKQRQLMKAIGNV